ncbi:MAG: hypothetical protein KAI62_03290, partial [Actinomycetia bacterium]|nr:hypothetical protein [Actinomycetes bacterium]
LRAAGAFISDSNEYAKKAGKQEHDYLELEQLKLRQDINETRKKIEIAEKSQSWEKYKKISENLDLLTNSLHEYQGLKGFTQSNYAAITELDLELGSIDTRIDEHKKEYEKIRSREAEVDEKIIEIQARTGPMENKKKDIDRFTNELEIYNRRKSEETREIGLFPKILAVVFLILSLASFPLVYLLIKDILISFIPLALFFFGSIGTIIYISRAGRGKSKFSARGKILENEFRKLGFKIRNLEDIASAVRAFKEQYYKISQKEDVLGDQKKRLDIQISENSVKIRNDENRKKTLILEKKKFFNSHNIYSVDQFSEKLQMRSRTESNILSSIRNMSGLSSTAGVDSGILEGIDNEFEKLSGKLEGSIETWKKEVEDLRPPDDAGTYEDQVFDSAAYGKLKDKLLNLQNKEDMHDQRLNEHRNNLNDFQRRFSHLNIEPYLKGYNAVNVNTLEKLKEACGIAENFIEIIESEYNIAIEALKIFEDIKSQEETKISDLFEKLGVSNVFKEITEGKYTGVQFDSKLQSVKIIDEFERELEASKLSKGTYDQLFMAIRIAIAEEILGEGKGFFIMDDAFLASDRYRIKSQFKILKKLADRGWSILYFSVKDEVRDLAAKFSKNKVQEI